MEWLSIDTASSWPSVFGVFFLLAAAVAVAGVYLLGRLWNQEKGAWSLLLAGALLGWMVFGKLWRVLSGDWIGQVASGALPHATGKSLLGGTLGAVLVVVVLRWILRRPSREAEAWALVLPFAVALGRLGCLLSGCCHGTVSALPWSITYPQGSPAFQVQVAAGVLPGSAGRSLPVHPAQLYEVAGLLLIGLVVARLHRRRRFANPGTSFLVMVAAYCVLRFCQEVCRHGGDMLWGMKTVQWGIALFGVFLAVLAVACERGGRRKQAQDFSGFSPGGARGEPSSGRPEVGNAPATGDLPCAFGTRSGAVALLLVVSGAVTAAFWLTPLERAALTVAVAPLVAHLVEWSSARLAAWAHSRKGTGFTRRLLDSNVAVGAVLAGLVLGLPATMPVGEDGTGSLAFDVSGGGGEWEHENCDESYRDSLVGGNLGVRYRYYYWKDHSVGAGVQGYYASVRRKSGPAEGNATQDIPWMLYREEEPAPYTFWGVLPYVAVDHEWFEARSGANILRHSNRDGYDLLPGAYVRLGPERKGFFEASYLLGDVPLLAAPVRIGGGWKLSTFGVMRTGLSLPWPAPYLHTSFFVPAGDVVVRVSPFGVWLPGDSGNRLFYFGGTVSLEIPVHD
ncbi:MAG: hypothetical protein FJ109_04385 [Deltaproteobacteria bacterium]|nr:hypothetical protein [Deltaproteobacteria bacterium]